MQCAPQCLGERIAESKRLHAQERTVLDMELRHFMLVVAVVGGRRRCVAVVIACLQVAFVGIGRIEECHTVIAVPALEQVGIIF